MKEPKITRQRLTELFDYNPETGRFLQKVKTSQRVKIGEPAGHLCKVRGYRHMRVDYVLYKEHRLVWLYVKGYYPTGVIDHINGNFADNRIENLREVTQAQNVCNIFKAKKHNKVGLLGVRELDGRYYAGIRASGKYYSLGGHASPEEAHEAYLKAKRKLHGEYCGI